MRRTFLIWLFAVICTSFVLTVVLVYSQFSRHAGERAAQMMSTRLNDMLELILHADRTTSYLSRVNDASTLDRTRALAEIVSLNPSLYDSQEDLQGICNRLGAEQIAITDENGTVVAAVPASRVGYNLAQSDDTRPFLACISAPGRELCIRSSSVDPDLQAMQYAGVHRLDSKGVVLLGFRTRLEQAVRESESLSRTSTNLRLGDGGRVFIFRLGALLSRPDPSFSSAQLLSLPAKKISSIVVNDEDYYAYAVEEGGYRLVAALPAREVNSSTVRAVQTLLASNFVLFLVMFGVVSYLLQRLVVRGISQVNTSLREITEGNLEKRVEVGGSPEFIRLSNGINFMVDSLKALGEEQRKSLQRDLELARRVQTTAMPNKFPAYPHIDSFDLRAACLQARVVGGDFYDFFMPDDKHLHFLVADVDANGIPAALYMMRALSVIRALAKVGSHPASLVSDVNRELCSGNKAGMRMALFYGCLDVETGSLDYVNAGLMHALVQHNGGEYELLGGRTDSPVGVQKNADYHSCTLQLEPHDRIFLYTEGVVHTLNAEHTPFGEGRLQEVLRQPSSSVAGVLQQVRSALRAFTNNAELQKDVTLLCLEFKGGMSNASSIELYASEAERAIAFVAEGMEAIFAAPPDISDLQFCARCALASLPPEIPVRLALDCDEQKAELTVVYPAPSFSPLKELPELPVDRARFRFTEEKGNELTFWKKLG
ncbi:MAG: SpoIIE family protein phosphatase [Akkermansiaceae bacterium]|nr:SpoIIE family protein phosphatase [Akkermansiaceae bacterium]